MDAPRPGVMCEALGFVLFGEQRGSLPGILVQYQVLTKYHKLLTTFPLIHTTAP